MWSGFGCGKVAVCNLWLNGLGYIVGEKGGSLKVNLYVLVNYKLCWTLVIYFEHTKCFLCSVSVWLLCRRLHVHWPMEVPSLHPRATKHFPFLCSVVHFISACFLVSVELIFETVQIRSVIFTHTHRILGKLVQLWKQIENLHGCPFNNCSVCCTGSQFCRLCFKMCTSLKFICILWLEGEVLFRIPPYTS